MVSAIKGIQKSNINRGIIMGCDIHFYIEERTHIFYEPWRFLEEIDLGRDYNLFGILAGVRSAAWQPIAPRRGLPIDVSCEVIKKITVDHHSFTYLRADEILSYNWHQKNPSSGYASPLSWRGYFENGKNKTLIYLGDKPSFDSAKIVSLKEVYKDAKKLAELAELEKNEDNQTLENEITRILDKCTFAHCTLNTSAAQWCPEFVNVVLPKLEKDFESLRCVFWFDN